MVEDRERLVLQGPGRLDGRRARVLRKDGWYRMIRWDLRAQNQEERIYLTGVDISGSEVLVAPSTRQLVGSWDWDITSDSATWSEGMFEIYGLLPLSAQSLQVALRRIYEDDRAVVAEVIRQALTTGGPYNATHRIVRRDSAIRHLYSAGRIFTGKDGAAERMRGLTWDITDAS
jgi:PAS domain-containing protein